MTGSSLDQPFSAEFPQRPRTSRAPSTSLTVVGSDNGDNLTLKAKASGEAPSKVEVVQDVPPEEENYDVANPPDRSTRAERIRNDLFLLVAVVFMVLWPWVVFGIIKGNDGIQMYGRLAESYPNYPHEIAIVVTILGTANRLAATFLLGKIVVRFGQEKIALANSRSVTVFGASALLAFRHASLVWGIGQWRQVTKGGGRVALFLLLVSYLVGLSLIPSGTAGLITPAEFNKTEKLSGTELDFFSEDAACLTWLETNRVQNNCDWKSFRGTQYTTCLGENQILDVLDSGRANMLSVIGIKNETSALGQLGAEGAIRFLGSVKGVLPNGPDGVPAFDSLNATFNPFTNPSIRRQMVSYNYSLVQQGLESTVSCNYDTSSPIRYSAIEAGLVDVLENIVDFPTLNTDNTLTYWACKQPPPPGTLDPTYLIYLRGRANYATSIGNITCKVSPMRAQMYSVDYLSLAGYFVAKPELSLDTQSSPRATFARYVEGGLIGLGALIWEAQNLSANLVAESVFSLAAKSLNLSTFETHPKYLELYAAMLQGVLEYEISSLIGPPTQQATYSRLIYSLGENPPQTCLRNITGSVTYSVRGWYISNAWTQAGLLLPMTLINLASLSLLIACFVIGKFQYRYQFDATDNVSLLAARVEGHQGRDGGIEWGNKVRYDLAQARGAT
ncbi:hypothetical protein MD484_g6641, partial [Candolleomyces efflorescens]